MGIPIGEIALQVGVGTIAAAIAIKEMETKIITERSGQRPIPQREFRFMSVKRRVGALFIEFIKRLLHGIDRMVVLVIDGHPAHKTRMVNHFIEFVKDHFQFFYLPSYSPELNPDKRVWNDLKNNAIGKQVITTPQHLYGAVISHLRFIQKSPDRVRSYYNNEITKYAA